MGGLLNKAPDEPATVKLDAAAADSMNKFADRASGSEISDLPSKAIQYGAEAFKGKPGQDAASSGQDPAMIKALHNQYYGKSKQEIDRLKSQGDLLGKMDKAQALQLAATRQIGQQRAMTEQHAFLTKAANQQEAAKAGAINQLFQLGAYGIGSVMANQKPSVAPSTSLSEMFPNPGGVGRVGGFQGNSQMME